jgi:competence protein ComEC
MYKTLSNLPAVRLLIPFLFGITFQYYYDDYTRYCIIGFILVSILLLLSLFPFIRNNYSYRWLFGISIFCFSFLGACLITQSYLSKSEWKIPNRYLDYRVRLLEDPVFKTKSLKCKAYVYNVEKKVLIYLSLRNNEDLRAGDELFVNTKFQMFEETDTKLEFNYADYMRKQGYSAFAYVTKECWKKNESSHFEYNIKSYALSCRRSLLDQLRNIITDEKAYSVSAALALGYMDAIDRDLRTSFSSTGASHVLVVSGLHTGVLYSAMYFLLNFFGKSKRVKYIRQIIILFVIWSFAFLTGLSASVTRAAIMISFVSIAEIFNQKPFTLNTVGASGLLMLLYNPLYLFDISFQLSYSAVIAIIVINPHLFGILKLRYSILKYVYGLITVSISAQIGTTPIALYYFHHFPNLFLLTNLFVIPLSAILLISLFVSLLLQSVITLPLIVFKPVNWLVEFFIGGVEFIEKIPYSLSSNILLDGFGIILMYFMFLFLLLLLIRKQIVYLCLFSLLVVFGVIYYL